MSHRKPSWPDVVRTVVFYALYRPEIFDIPGCPNYAQDVLRAVEDSGQKLPCCPKPPPLDPQHLERLQCAIERLLSKKEKPLDLHPVDLLAVLDNINHPKPLWCQG